LAKLFHAAHPPGNELKLHLAVTKVKKLMVWVDVVSTNRQLVASKKASYRTALRHLLINHVCH